MGTAREKRPCGRSMHRKPQTSSTCPSGRRSPLTTIWRLRHTTDSDSGGEARHLDQDREVVAGFEDVHGRRPLARREVLAAIERAQAREDLLDLPLQEGQLGARVLVAFA